MPRENRRHGVPDWQGHPDWQGDQQWQAHPEWHGEVERQRRVHRTDWMALLSGTLFVVLGILLLTRSITEPLVLSGLLVVGLGFAGLVAVVARVVRGK